MVSWEEAAARYPGFYESYLTSGSLVVEPGQTARIVPLEGGKWPEWYATRRTPTQQELYSFFQFPADQPRIEGMVYTSEESKEEALAALEGVGDLAPGLKDLVETATIGPGFGEEEAKGEGSGAGAIGLLAAVLPFLL